MGVGQIVSGGPLGRYSLSLDYGESTRVATIEAGNAQRAKLLEREAKAQAKLSAAEAEYQTARQGYVQALNVAIEMLVAAQSLPSITSVHAEAQAIKQRAQTAHDEATAIHAIKLVELQAAQGTVQTLQGSVASLQADLQAKEAAQAAAVQEQTEATAAYAIAQTQLATQQQQVNQAEAEYAAAVQSGVNVEAKRIAMENAQAALSNVIALKDQAQARLQQANADALEAAAEVAAVQAELQPLQNQLADAQDAVELAALAEQGALANKQITQAALQRAEEAAAEILAQPSTDAATAKAKQEVLAAQNQIAQIDVQNLPLLSELQRSLAAIKVAIGQINDMISRWTRAVVIETKPVWCVDFTENGSGQVGTIDINGETDITLIAPGCRGWTGGDGTVSTEAKATAIARITARQAQLTARQARLDTEITDATAAESSAKANLDAAHLAYQLASEPDKPATGRRVDQAAAEYQARVAALRQLKARRVQTQSLIVEEDRKLSRWQAKPASDNPAYGDGTMQSTLIMSPAQNFVNRALLPGWQRHMPTYRWGTIATLDKDADTCTVELAGATSSQQNLNINLQSTLTNVPVVYMRCNAKAFEEGDEVVVQFESQSWDKPRVIGFLSNPKECKLYKATYRQVGLIPFAGGASNVNTVVDRYKDETWGSVAARAPSAKHKFLGWDDGVSTLLRDDGVATVDITKTAQYTFAPDFELAYYWNIQAEPLGEPYWSGQLYLRDWQVRSYGNFEWREQELFGAIADTPAPQNFDAIIWVGQSLGGASPDDVVNDLTAPWLQLGNVNPPGPIYLPQYPTTNAATVTFKVPGVNNVYTVNGTGDEVTNPAPGGQHPDTGSNTGGFIIFKFTATSWSATYG
jgi:hypothetical protein